MATATRPPATVATGRVDPPSPARQRVRVPQLVVGLLLTAGAALGFVLFNAATVQRSPVLALTDDVERGHVLTPEDLQVVHVGSDDVLNLSPADRSEQLVGRAAIGALSAGTLVTTEQFAAAGMLTPGGGVVGLALAPGEYPSPRLRIGDLVTVVDVTEEQQVLVEAAEVVESEPVGTQGQRFVSLLTGEDAATTVATAAAAGQVRLVLVARDEPAADTDSREGGGS
jgi:hypothetical protein